MKIRLLTASEVEFSMHLMEDDTSVRGNVVSSGNEEHDVQVENEVIRAVMRGDEWAWALVTVTARWSQFKGHDTLGGLSYVGMGRIGAGVLPFKIRFDGTIPQEFACDELPSMMTAALNELNHQIQATFDLMKERVEVEPLDMGFICDRKGCGAPAGNWDLDQTWCDKHCDPEKYHYEYKER